MKTKATRLLSLLLVLIMVAGLLPTMAMADTQPNFTVVRTGSTTVEEFTNIDSAWKAVAANGGVLTMNADAKPGSSLNVTSGKNVKIVGNGHTINRGLTTAVDNGQVFLLRSKSTLTLTNLTVTGGYNNGGGGGIHLQENAVLKLEGVTITQNYTRETNGGAGLRLQGKNSYVSMDENTVITDNDSMVDSGGGISLMGEGAAISGGNAQVYNNYTEKNGGAIHCGAEGCAVSDLRIYENYALGNGGAIFMSQGHGFAVSNCKIYNNTAENNGGGIYVNGNGGSLSNSTVTGNIAFNQGGGIYVDDGDTLSLSGKLSVYGNTGNGNSAAYDDNLYLDTEDGNLGYISGTPSEPMEEGKLVHIGWNTAKRTGNPTRISNKKGTNDVRYLVSDVPNYTIYWSWGANDGINDRKIRAATSNKYSIPVIPTVEIPAADRYDKDYTTYNGYDVQRGLFSYKATEGDDRQALYYYSDGYFAEDPAVYNNHLATMSLALTMSAFNSAGSEFDDTDPEVGGYRNRARNAIQLLGDLGFDSRNVHVSETFLKKPTDYSIGVIMGAKKLTTIYENGKPCILVPIAVRGAGYEMEWVSNVTLGSSGEAAGFSDAADQVMFELYLFMNQENNSIDLQEALDEGRVKFWVTGFSRSAATANLTAKRLTDEYCANGNEVFAYCYEAPKGGVQSAITVKADYNYNGQYHNIHNIINKSDIVPYVGPAEMGFFRYGVDHFVPGTDAGTVSTETFSYGSNVKFDQYYDNKGIEVTRSTKDTYYKQRSIMTQHLGAVDSRILFDDYFNVASMEYVFNKFFGIDMVHELSGWDMTAAEWIPLFFQDLQKWACQYTYNNGSKENKHNGDFRKFYSTHRKFAGMSGQPTVEEALQAAVTVVFGLEETAELMDAMMYRLSKLDLMSLYWNEIWWYYHGTYSQQQNTINKLWNQLNKSMTRYGEPVPALRDLVTTEQYQKLETAFPTLISFLLQFINEDYWGSPLEAEERHNPPTQVHLGTLAYNMSGVLQNHYPEVCMAWLRTYDSFYTTDSGTLDIDAGSEYVLTEKTVASSAKIFLNGSTVHKENYTSCVEIVLEPATSSVMEAEGSAIYYRMEGWGGNSGFVCDWRLYDGPFYVTAFTDTKEDTRVDLQVKVVRYQQASEIQNVSFTITPLRKHVLTVQNSFDNNIRNFYVMAGEQMTIQSPFDKEIWKWVVEKDDGTITDVIPSADNADATGTAEEFVITMPNEALYYTVFYKKEVSLLDMIGLRPVAGEILPTEELTMYTHHYNAYLTVPQETVTTQVQWLDAEGNDVTGQTAEENAAYRAVVTVTANEAPEKSGKLIQPAIFTDATAANVMGAQTVSVEKQSSTVAVVTCEFPAAQDAQTHNLDVQTYDLNLQAATTTEGNLPEDFALEYAEGTVVSVPAPVFDNMEFVTWQVSDEIAAANTDLVLTEQTLSFTVPYFEAAGQTLTVTAQYKPVINKIEIEIPALEEDGTFPEAVTAATVTVRNAYEIDPADVYVEWETTDEAVVADKSYTAYIYADQYNIDLEDGSSVSGNVTFNSSTEAYINGEQTTLMFSGHMPMVVWDTSTSKVIEQIITDVIAPSNISVTRDADGNLPTDVELPAEVAVTSTNALLTSVAVENWDYSYSAASLEAQQITCIGTLVIPEGVTIAENVWAKDADPETEGFQVSLTVYTEAADQADMPEAMPDSDEYTGEVILYAEEGSTIYYTVDGTTPTTESAVYTDGITVEPTFDAPVTVMAIAVVDGKLPSAVAAFTYTAPAAEDEATTFHVYGHNVRLQDVLRVGFYLYVETSREFEGFGVLVSTDPDAVAAAEGDDHSSSVTNKILTAESYPVNGAATDIYTYETDGVCPQNMDTVFYLKPYIRIDGQYIYGDVDDYSVLEYAQYVYHTEGAADDETKALVMDLTNYATAARAYFCYTEGLEQPAEPFNSFMTQEEQTVEWTEDLNSTYGTVEETGELDAVFYGKNANILEAISTGVYFQDTRVLGALYWNSTDYAANTVHDETTATGTAVMQDDLGEGFVKTSVPGIYSFNIYDTYYLRGYDVDGLLTDTYVLNVAAYLTSLINFYAESTDATEQAALALAKAMQVYGWNAKEYFANR